MRTFEKSTKLDNVCYDVRGPVVEEADRMIADGVHILKLNIGNPAPFGFTAPEEVIRDMMRNLPETEGYSDSKGLFPARKAIMQYCQLKKISNVEIGDIYTGNGVSELITMSMQGLLNNGDEILMPSPDYPLWTAAANLAGGHPVHLCAMRRPTGIPTWMISGARSQTGPRESSSSTPTTRRALFIRGRFYRRSWILRENIS